LPHSTANHTPTFGEKSAEERILFWSEERGFLMIATCQSCGSKFERDEPWKKLCLPCWQKSKRQEKAPFFGTLNEVEQLRREVALVTMQRDNLSKALSRMQSEHNERAKARQAMPIPPNDMLRRLILLCHPDKHNGSQASVAATMWLLE
jgi:predicted amidophosphoribosyltransferase